VNHPADYHRMTSYRRDRLPGAPPGEAPPPFKRYADDLPRVELPRPEKLPTASFWETVAHRRSVRDYVAAPLSTEELFLLLWATQGITRPGRLPMRATPSAGALYPVETYVAVGRVDGLAPGLYHWELPEERLVELRRDEAIARCVAAACLDQAMCAGSACIFLWTAVFDRTAAKYGARGIRYVYLDAGHVGQNLQLAATALDLGSCNIGALFDDEVNELLGVDGRLEAVVYAAAVGRTA